MTLFTKAIFKVLRKNWRRLGCLTVIVIVAVGIPLAVSGYRTPPVRFTLKFENCPMPDVSSYQALILHGSGFDYHKNVYQEYVLYEWFARALLANNLPMSLTYRGYAQINNCGRFETNSNLKDMATDFVISTQIKDHEVGVHGRNFDGISLSRLIGHFSKVLPDGAPYPWVLPKIKGKCYSKVVWDAAYWDMVAAFGTEDEKRRILSVEVDYDQERRLMVNAHSPSIGVDSVETGFRMIFRDGVGGSVFARLHVSYPRANSFFGSDSSASNFYDPLMRFVFSEMKKVANSGQIIVGSYKSGSDATSFGGVVGNVYVDGNDKPMLSVELDGYIRSTRQQCVNLQNIIEIPNEAYAKQSELREVEFSSVLNRIGSCAFAGCSMLCHGQGELLLPEGLNNIGNGAFAACSNIRRVIIPSSVKKLGAWAFAECTSLRYVTLPSSIVEIPNGLFYNCRLEKVCYDGVAIPSAVRRIGKYAFAFNSRLTEIELPESVDEIDDYAFYCCTALTNVVVRGKLNRIGEGAFWGCKKLKRSKLPSSIKLGDEAFGGLIAWGTIAWGTVPIGEK
jgi:hypothetical protein